MDLQLAGKTALVTGATAGIGLAIASMLIARMIEADEIAAMVALLASPLGAASNGAAVRVEGGTFRSIL
jgi:NAD(P)-dependent dehydrogenase (short-subunit alcohol dehydrogenase family)